MSNTIKINVEYEVPKTDGFFNLLKQYEEVKKSADETVHYYRPLAETAEQAKMDAILEQLESIKTYMIELNKLNSDIREMHIYFRIDNSVENGHFAVKIYAGEVSFSWHTFAFSKQAYNTSNWKFTDERCDYLNILGNWEKWNVYGRLEKECFRQLNEEIEKQKNRAEKEIARLRNITKEV